MIELNRYMDYFLNRYDAYLEGIRAVQSGLQVIHTINPGFILSLPFFSPIVITPVMWFIINFLHTDYVWDPIIFRLLPITPYFIQDLVSLAGGTYVQSIIQHIYTSYFRSRLPLASLPLNYFANSNPINLFEIETEQRRSPARTRAPSSYRDLYD